MSAAPLLASPAPTATVRPSPPPKTHSGALTFTIYTADGSQRLTKRFGLDKAGKLTRTTVVTMSTGRAERVEVDNLAAFADRLDGLTDRQAVGFGAFASASVRIVKADADDGHDPDKASRTRSNVMFAKGPGVLMLDIDGTPDGPLDADALRAKLIEACPALAGASMLIRPSASAGLVAPDGRELTPAGRWRIYIAVADASMIPTAGARLVTLLQSAGMSWCEVGNAGQALQRCLVDPSVWQPERLDFAAPPIVADGIHRNVPERRIVGDPAALFDLALIVVTPIQEKAAAKYRKDNRAAVREACRVKREEWAMARAPALAEARKITVDKARDVLIRASEHGKLTGDFLVTMRDGSRVSVGEILDNQERWHNARCADPLDPDEDRRVGRVNLRSGGRPFIFSHRHGGMFYELMRQCVRIQVGRGRRIEAVDSTMRVVQDRGELFDHGDAGIAYVAAGRVRPVSQDFLVDYIGRACEFFSVRGRQSADGSAETVETPEDAPTPVAKAILAKNGERGLRPLVAVIMAPTLRADGSILDAPGYDDASGLLYYCAGPTPPTVPEHPSVDDALGALRLLWSLIAGFPLVDDTARAVVLHGLLTAGVRASLPTAPAIALDAPAAGTGKTLLARTIAALFAGTDPAILAPVEDDAEIRKRLFAELLSGARAIVWDNVREPLGSAAIDAFLTAGDYRDRILGVSESATRPNRSMFLVTGNNVRLLGDTCRRIFVARLDAETERPYAREFDFDPVQRILADRGRYVVAALTIIRAYITAGRPRVAKGRTASFETWDDLVRQPIVWLAGHVRERSDPTLPKLGDPLDAASRAFDTDPETTKHAALLHAWHAAFGATACKVSEAIGRATGSLESPSDALGKELSDAIDAIVGPRARSPAHILGRWIVRMTGRRIGGMWFASDGLSHGSTRWKVEGRPAQNEPPEPPEPPSRAPWMAEKGGSGTSGGSFPVVPRSGSAAAEATVGFGEIE